MARNYSGSMHIFHIMAGRKNGGAEIYSVDVMIGLHEAGLRQTIVVPEDSPAARRLTEAGVPVETNILKTPFSFLKKKRIKTLLHERKPDVVQCWMRRAASFVPRNAWELTSRRRVIGWFGNYRQLGPYAHCTDLVGCTPDIAEHMRQMDWSPVDTRFPSGRVHAIPTFSSVNAAPPLSRASLDTPEDAPLLLVLSRLHPAKGLEPLIAAMKALPECYLWIAGEGPLRQKLEQQAQAERVGDRIRFLGWRTDRGALLATADICVLPSRYEPFGTVILEAWMTGTPLVACAAAGPKAFVRSGENGMLAEIDDVDSLTRALRSVLSDNALKERLIENGLKEYDDLFTKKKIIADWIGLYRG